MSEFLSAPMTRDRIAAAFAKAGGECPFARRWRSAAPVVFGADDRMLEIARGAALPAHDAMMPVAARGPGHPLRPAARAGRAR